LESDFDGGLLTIALKASPICGQRIVSEL
jgi:hypothetical protein